MAGPLRQRRRGPAIVSRRARGSDPEVAFELRGLETGLDRTEETGRVGAVDDAVVVREREVDVRTDRDRVLAVDRDHAGLLHDRTETEDGRLREEDDRGVEQRATRTRVGEGERATGELVGLQLVVARPGRQVGDLTRELGDVLVAGVLDDRVSRPRSVSTAIATFS